MSEGPTAFTDYELKDLATGKSWWFEDLNEARVAVGALSLLKWLIVSGHDNVVDRSHPEEEAPVQRFRRLWRKEFGTPRAPMVDVREHPPYAAVIAALDSVPPGIALDIIHVWAAERGHKNELLKSELIETLEGEQPNYTVPAHDLPPEVPSVMVYTGREW